MAARTFDLLLSIVVLGVFLSHIKASCNNIIKKSSFPNDFIFGAGSSAYQTEGAAHIDGKGLSNWDYSTHKRPAITWDGSNGNVADDFYHRYKDDIKLMKNIGLTHFRFSISWSRILPNGTKAGGVNQLGIDFYNNLIDELLANGIKPFVTLFHWDVPQALEEAYGGFLSTKIVQDFVNFADICFKEFGDRVKNWVTMNDPNSYAQLGYALGYEVPNRCTKLNPTINSVDDTEICVGGNSGTEPYIVAHNLLLSHASAVELYRKNYQDSQNGKIGIAVTCSWVEPFDTKPKTLKATKRYFEHYCGWFFNPVTYGDYPEIMHKMVGDRLPKFTVDQSNLLKKSYDFLGLDYFTSAYIHEDNNATRPHYELDVHADKTFFDKHGKPIGKPTPFFLIFNYPTGLEKITLYMQRKYNNPVIIVTANGYATQDGKNGTRFTDFYLKDGPRIAYVKGHIEHLHRAIKSGANVKGYFVKSFLDNFEWSYGNVLKYGLVYVDRKNGLKRHLKNSAKWYRHFLHH